MGPPWPAPNRFRSTKSPVGKTTGWSLAFNCHVTRSDCSFLVLFLNSICFGQMPTRHCPKHMIPFSRISIQRTSTNQICETPYLNECKNVIPTTSTNHKLSHLTSYIFMNSIWIPMKLPTKSTHPHPLDPLPRRSRLGAPRFFPPKISCEFFRWPACKGTPSEGKTLWDKTILNY